MLVNKTSNQEQFTGDDRDRHFRTDHLSQNLGGRSIRGGMVTAIAQGLKFVITTAATIVLARLLTPQDYGLIGMVAILMSLVGMFQYLGLSTATVKWTDLSHQQVSTLFWINMALSAGMTLLTILSAPLVARFYREPRLFWVTIAYAGSMLVTGLYIQHEAILIRQMRFTVIAVIEIVSIALGLVVAIAAAWFGAGYWALVLNLHVMTLVMIVGTWTACRWRPSWPARDTAIRSMLSYGGNLTGYNLMSFFARNLDNALLGRFWGAYQLGIYSRAYQMLLMPMAQINNPLLTVAVPALSRLSESPERYRSAYLKILEKIAMITMPGVAFMIATSDWLVLFLLGKQWSGAGRIFMLLGLAAIVQPAARSALWLFTTQGRSREMLTWGVISGAIAIISIVAGLPWGATGVAASYAATDLCIGTPLLFWFVGRRGPVRTSDFYRTIAPSACAAICSLVVLVLSRQWLAMFSHLATRLCIAFAVTGLVSFLVLAAIPAGREAMRNFKSMLSLLLKRESESVV